MSAYADGRRVEYAVMHDLTERGFLCTRAASSKGTADVIAIGLGLVLLVSVKRSKPVLPPAERRALLSAASRLPDIAVPLVAYKPSREPLRYRRLTGTLPNAWEVWP